MRSCSTIFRAVLPPSAIRVSGFLQLPAPPSLACGFGLPTHQMAVSLSVSCLNLRQKKRGKGEGQMHVPTESAPSTGFPTAPPRDFCLSLNKHNWDSEDISVSGCLHCFWNKIGVLFVMMKRRQARHFLVSCATWQYLVSQGRALGAHAFEGYVFPPHHWVTQTTAPSFHCFPSYHPSFLIPQSPSWATVLTWSLAASQHPSPASPSAPLTTSRVLLSVEQISNAGHSAAWLLMLIGGWQPCLQPPSYEAGPP